MLNRSQRIDSREFRTLRSGVTVRTPLFNAKKYSGSDKLAIIISKKYIKKSNKRNALRRKICYAYRQQLSKDSNSATPSTIVINYIYRDAKQDLPSYQDIQNQINIICGTH